MTKKFPGGRRSRTPASDRTSPLDAVTRLIEERDKYEQWLEELEAKKASTPPKVFDRVRQDYLTRLQTVMDQLREHTAVLQEHAANLVAKLRELEASEQEITDELAETELRAQVGEITEAEWEATSRKAQREVAKLNESQEVIADDLIKIRDILSDDDEPADEDEEAPRTSADFDELEFLKSVVGPTGSTPTSTPQAKRPATPPGGSAALAGQTAPRRPTPAGTAAAPSAPASAAPASAKPDAARTSGSSAAAGTPAGGTPRVPAAGSGAPAQPGAAAARASGAVPAPRPSGATTAPAAASSAPPAPPAAPARPAAQPPKSEPKPSPEAAAAPDNALGLRSSDVAEKPKTLKCAECGTMNYASEWYCERCGAELAQI